MDRLAVSRTSELKICGNMMSELRQSVAVGRGRKRSGIIVISQAAIRWAIHSAQSGMAAVPNTFTVQFTELKQVASAAIKLLPALYACL